MSQIIINLNNTTDGVSISGRSSSGSGRSVSRDSTSAAASVFVNQVFNVAKNAVTLAVTTTTNRYNSLYEDYIGEQTSKNYATVIKKSSALILPLVTGHPVISGLVLAHDIYNSFNKYVDSIQKLNTTDYNTNFGRIRAGLVDNGKGTEN